VSHPKVSVIGGGLAGCEAAFQLTKRGIGVRLFEMKPEKRSPAHQLDGLAELVCSNTFRSEDVTRAPGLLKEEMRRSGSFLLELAEKARVPAGGAFGIDRQLFSDVVTEAVTTDPLIEVVYKELTEIPDDWTIVATGPLTSDGLSKAIAELCGAEHLYFYDAIAPIVDADSIDREVVWAESRYGKGAGDDYLNCPMDSLQYDGFVADVRAAEVVPAKDFEELRYFEGCLPVEVMASRGLDTLRYGPMKPVGLRDPRTGRQTHAVVQLRAENVDRTAFNLVGFQSRMTWGEQKRVFRTIPGLERASFLRMGSVHRNTFLNGPDLLDPDLSFRGRPQLHFAGQMTGVEGYIESMAMGLLAGISIARRMRDQDYHPPPAETALGALTRHISGGLVYPKKGYQPSNVQYGMFPALPKRLPKKLRSAAYSERALGALAEWLQVHALRP
jgi:methylenetetrahydrofolate--tRNA-(uracil-5-)-methyltransferase